VEIWQIRFDVVAAVQRGDSLTALSRAAQAPDMRLPDLLFYKGRAHLMTNDYAAAESDFRRELAAERSLENGSVMIDRTPALGVLSHYYLGEVYERTGKRDQAVNEYQEFLAHFASTQNRPAEVGEARNALKRLMQ
jgi:tetratricopeptide (TPR) repeat protein